MLDKTTTIEKFLEGGGGGSRRRRGRERDGAGGAPAAAMGEMVVNYSVGKKGLEEHEESLKLAMEEFRRAREMMLELVAEDQTAYEAFRAARKAAAGSPHLMSKIEEAAMMCVQVPQSVAGTAVAMLELVDKLVEKVNRQLLSDLAVCAELAIGTARAAIYNVRVNLPEVGDIQQCRMIEAMDRDLLERATALIQRVMARIWERVAEG